MTGVEGTRVGRYRYLVVAVIWGTFLMGAFDRTALSLLLADPGLLKDMGLLTYDSKSDRSILSVLSADFSTLQTWAYDANSDTGTRLADGPHRLVGQRLAYDKESDRIIMFGGFDFSNFKLVDETWVYNYNTNTWTDMQPRVHPSSRNFIGMVYDAKADRVVMWGDWQRNYTPATDESVWTYDYNTNTWQEFQHKNDGPNVRDYTMLAYDEKADKIIMYGGYDY